MVALTAALIVFLASGLILVFSQRFWNHGLQQATLQRDASYAMLRIKQSIRNGTGAALDSGGLGVTINHAGGSIRYWFVGAQRDLRYQISGQPEETLLDGIVESASFQIDSTTHKTVTASIELANGDCESRLSSTTLMRNFPTGP